MRMILILFLCAINFQLLAQEYSIHNEDSTFDRKQRFKRNIETITFIPKGQWLVGTTFKYKENESYNFNGLITEGLTGNGFDLSVSPFVAYFLRDNFAIGARFTYDRNANFIDEMTIKIDDDLSFTIEGKEEIAHMFYSTFFMRHYLNLGNSKRFGLFNEIRLSYGYGQSKSQINEVDPSDTTGMYSVINEFNIGVSPGMVAFINDRVALEVMVGILGFSNKWIKQTENQVEEGWRRSSSANFNIDMFSLNIGLAFYL